MAYNFGHMSESEPGVAIVTHHTHLPGVALTSVEIDGIGAVVAVPDELHDTLDRFRAEQAAAQESTAGSLQLSDEDSDLIERLGRIAEIVDPVPAGVVERSKQLLAERGVDEEERRDLVNLAFGLMTAELSEPAPEVTRTQAESSVANTTKTDGETE